jgi:16S rRNA (uracil1498-N3)-methyltransferase
MPLPADAAPAWLWLPALPDPGAAVAFDDADRHYLRRVCRARAGDRVTATDGRGRIARLALNDGGSGLGAVVESVERRGRRREATILCGAPEGERGDWLVEKLAELGIARLQPVDTARAEWERSAREGRWQRLAVAALRQSRGAFLLEILEPVPLGRAIGSLASGSTRWLADPAGPSGLTPASAGPISVAAIGPSSGFDDEEWTRLRDEGFEPISLSESRLRTETAALAWACWWAGG